MRTSNLTVQRKCYVGLVHLKTGMILEVSTDGTGQRIYISDRTHSIPQRLPNMCLTHRISIQQEGKRGGGEALLHSN